MTTARHYTTDHTLWFCSVGSTGTIFVEHDARGTADFKTLKTTYLNHEFICSILSTVQIIQILNFISYGNELLMKQIFITLPTFLV